MGERLQRDGAERNPGFRSLAETVGPVLGPALRRRSGPLVSLQLAWPRLIGSNLAPHCWPESLRFPPRRRSGATLYLSVDGGVRGVEIQHRTPAMISDINGFLGSPVVERIYIRAIGTAVPADRTFRRPFEQAAVNNSDLLRVERLVACIEAPLLRTALMSLGAQVLAAQTKGD